MFDREDFYRLTVSNQKEKLFSIDLVTGTTCGDVCLLRC